MADLNLILTIPQGVVTATSLGIAGLARHRSPGSGKHFLGRSIFADLAVSNGRPDFEFLNEGGWRDAAGDTQAALDAIRAGKRTKTALSNNGFSCTPVDAYRRCFLVKTGGEVMELELRGEVAHFRRGDCQEGMSPTEVAEAAGTPDPGRRAPRLYMVLSPIEFLVLSNLTPGEYAWYATHRPGKVFRQVVFAELRADQTHLAAESRFNDAREELLGQPNKKTKTIVFEDCINRVPFPAWVGYHREAPGGLYVADKTRLSLWEFPVEIPRSWERVDG